MSLTQECCVIHTFSVGLAPDLDLPRALAQDPGPALAASRGVGRFLIAVHIIFAYL